MERKSKTKDKVDADVLELDSEEILPIVTNDAPVLVTFIGQTFCTPNGTERSLRYQMIVPDGNVGRAIAGVRKNGGVFFQKSTARGERWFLPWPPAAIKVSPAPKKKT